MLDFVSPIPGRRVDLLVFPHPNPGQLLRLSPSLQLSSGGQATTGLQKLAQMIVVQLYSSSRQRLYDKQRATTFIDDITNGIIRTAADARRSFEFARLDLLNQALRDTETVSRPLDEQLSDIVLQDVAIDSPVLSLTFSIVSRAGSTGQFVFPVSVA
jgi:hypothetical protein